MSINIQALVNDMADAENIRLAQEYVPYVLNELSTGMKTLDDLYQGDYYDIPLYIALHQLVKTGLVLGISPYRDDVPHNHKSLKYWKKF